MKEKETHGRTYKYQDSDEFQDKCDEYFRLCDENTVVNDAGVEVSRPIPYLKTGLALHLDVSTNTLLRNSKDPDSPIRSIVKKCNTKIKHDLEIRSILNGKQAIGCLFNLKCNHGMIETSKTILGGDVALIDNRSDEELDNEINSLAGEVDSEI